MTTTTMIDNFLNQAGVNINLTRQYGTICNARIELGLAGWRKTEKGFAFYPFVYGDMDSATKANADCLAELANDNSDNLPPTFAVRFLMRKEEVFNLNFDKIENWFEEKVVPSYTPHFSSANATWAEDGDNATLESLAKIGELGNLNGQNFLVEIRQHVTELESGKKVYTPYIYRFFKTWEEAKEACGDYWNENVPMSQLNIPRPEEFNDFDGNLTWKDALAEIMRRLPDFPKPTNDNDVVTLANALFNDPSLKLMNVPLDTYMAIAKTY